MDITIRQAAPDDAVELLDFMHWRGSRALNFNPAEFWVKDAAQEIDEIEKFAKSDNSVFLVAEMWIGDVAELLNQPGHALVNPGLLNPDKQRIVGICTLAGRGVRTGNEREAEKHVAQLGLVVDPFLTGHGIGTSRLLSALGSAKRSGVVRRIEVQSYETNERARNLYKRMGFKIEGRKIKAIKLDGKYIDVFMMALWLNESQEGMREIEGSSSIGDREPVSAKPRPRVGETMAPVPNEERALVCNSVLLDGNDSNRQARVLGDRSG